jgi:hypothetical protein
MEDIYDIEVMYQKYLGMMSLAETNMHPVQRIETKRAFYGATGLILDTLHNELPQLSDDEGAEKLEQMIKQASRFWKAQEK